MDKCPRCKCEADLNRGSMSRRDNATKICVSCGTEEALVDLLVHIGVELPQEWAEREAVMLKLIIAEGGY